MNNNRFRFLAILGTLAIAGGIMSCSPSTSSTKKSDTSVATSSSVVKTSSAAVSSAESASSAQGSSQSGKNTFTFEGEYIDMTGLRGGGISGAQSGVNMLQEASSASNGWFIGYTHKLGLTLTFNITSDKAGSATMVLALGTELGVMTMNPTTFILKVNDAAVNYTAFNIKANSSQTGTDFRDYTIAPTVNLIAGANAITFTIGENEYCNGSAGGPLFDAMKLTTEAALTWTPHTENIA
jgi:hypothetical protein